MITTKTTDHPPVAPALERYARSLVTVTGPFSPAASDLLIGAATRHGIRVHAASMMVKPDPISAACDASDAVAEMLDNLTGRGRFA